MELRFWAATDTGRVRDHNEDNFLVDKRLQLFVVCDGMGGHAAGEVASAVCVRTVRDVIAPEAELLAHLRENPDEEAARRSVQELLRHAIKTACARIFEMARQDPSRRGMGTTCTALILAGSRGFIGHVGDSRMYRLRDGQVDQVTMDHSLLNEMIRQGKISPDTVESEFPHKNAVTRAVGVREFVEVDAFEFDVQSGDRLVMCSDGLSEYFGPGVDLPKMIGGQDPEPTTSKCIDYANQSGGKDNITVIVIDCTVAEEADEEEVAQVIEILRNTAYFHYLAPPELQYIRKLAEREEFDADETVIGGEKANDRLYIILKGSISLQLDGRQVSVLTTGEHFGEMALIDAQDEQDGNLVAQTLEPTVVLTIARDQFVALLRNAPGLAIKLLWNFVQVFADRLQSVPPEYRFTPDEWRREPESGMDVTPPSGSLVFEEDLRRLEQKSVGLSGLGDFGGDDAVLGGGARTISSVGQKALSPDDEEMVHRETVDLGNVDLSELTSPPPQVGVLSSASSMAKKAEQRRKDTVDDDLEEGGVSFGKSRTDLREDSDGGARRGLTSGTYDSSVLAAGFDDDVDEGPTVKFKTATAAKEAGGDEISSPVEDREDLRATVQFDHAPGLSFDESSGTDGGSGDDDLAKTVDFNADVEQLRELKAQSPTALKDKLRRRIKDRSATDKAPPNAPPKAPPNLPPNLAASEQNEDKGEDAGNSASAGESSVQPSRPSQPEPVQPKIMISSDLMADVDED